MALMTAVIYQLGRSAITDWLTAGLAIVGAVLLVRFRINSAWLVLGGAIVGVAARMLRGG
jgi:chromate transporter